MIFLISAQGPREGLGPWKEGISHVVKPCFFTCDESRDGPGQDGVDLRARGALGGEVGHNLGAGGDVLGGLEDDHAALGGDRAEVRSQVLCLGGAPKKADPVGPPELASESEIVDLVQSAVQQTNLKIRKIEEGGRKGKIITLLQRGEKGEREIIN